MDHAEEQEMELQALEAIYDADFKKDDASSSFEVTFVPETGAGDDVNHVSMALRVVYTPTYPEAPPELSLQPVRRGGEAGRAAAGGRDPTADALGRRGDVLLV